MLGAETLNLKPSKPTPPSKPKVKRESAPKPEKRDLPRRASKRIAGEKVELKSLRYSNRLVDNEDRHIQYCELSGSEGSNDDRESRDESDESEEQKRKGKVGVVTRGGRVYDSVNGTSCHQCRQKTLDPKVRCTNMLVVRHSDGTEEKFQCPLMLDELCLDGRYGENLEEAKAKGDWICPNVSDYLASLDEKTGKKRKKKGSSTDKENENGKKMKKDEGEDEEEGQDQDEDQCEDQNQEDGSGDDEEGSDG
ncbi:hypothetical protein HDU76_003459 [Blyttiomyces sp. JEL0837]|nr:hypothetical protein HDU76_003459 [Blyttiomyces sp. JEL0837]